MQTCDKRNSERPELHLVRWKAGWWPESGRESGCTLDPTWWRYLFARDEQGCDPKQLEAVGSHRRGGQKAVQSVHRQAERFEGEAEPAVHGDQPAEQLTAGLGRHLRGTWEGGPLSLGPGGPAEGTSQENSGSFPGGRDKKEKPQCAADWETLGPRCCAQSAVGLVPGPAPRVHTRYLA